MDKHDMDFAKRVGRYLASKAHLGSMVGNSGNTVPLSGILVIDDSVTEDELNNFKKHFKEEFKKHRFIILRSPKRG